MRTTDLLAALEREGDLLTAAAERAGWDAPVPSCPGWAVRDLLTHQGHVHRWAARNVAERLSARTPRGTEAVPDGELAAWFRAGHRELLDVLERAPEDMECWTFLNGSPTPRHFWARRQAHETAIHRVDAELAAGEPLSPFAPGVAVDGVDELLAGFHTRFRSRVRSERPRTLAVRATDEPGAVWTVLISTEPPRVSRPEVAGAAGVAECEISGRAAELYPALWNRLPYEGVLAVTGDAAVAGLWRETSGI
ncbi:maleylpyruvate isomerase family mycothiol-dependent enzyme [Streptomyces sp. NBC_01803]|uniref:maleylpyruvate isomerase family mycothiol-dependent enzyme n=1 Tax=Streptomyces sp. NBC_01803 TaxID=2975946 RepID=UPI002DDA2907|nr:maleylpyruvate isomerase family mycothiol-dependent enzyme [Streptomyces sp. NBC_01803]WSA42841.1 maleylpyruvate isomerase family mycothiol-dependent enzyme [Streptomyces sp. NBC_01803]